MTDSFMNQMQLKLEKLHSVLMVSFIASSIKTKYLKLKSNSVVLSFKCPHKSQNKFIAFETVKPQNAKCLET